MTNFFVERILPNEFSETTFVLILLLKIRKAKFVRPVPKNREQIRKVPGKIRGRIRATHLKIRRQIRATRFKIRTRIRETGFEIRWRLRVARRA